MPSAKDLFASGQADPKQGRFRLSTNRKVDLTLQKELDDISRRSLAEIAASKEAKSREVLTGQEYNVRKLASEFQPAKIFEQRKTRPIFHDELSAKTPRTKSPKGHTVSVYNGLDRDHSEKLGNKDIKPPKTKKFPFRKTDVVTTEDMKRPHVTSVGVVPAPGGPIEQVETLRVRMEGRPAIKLEDPVIGPVQRANTAPTVPQVTAAAPDEAACEPVWLCEELGHQPAIVGSVGTTQPAIFIERPPPQPKPMTRLRTYRIKSAKSEASSFKSIEIHLPDDNVYRQYDEAIAELDGSEDGGVVGGPHPRVKSGQRLPDDQRSVASSAQTVKSVKELVEEAKQIASSPGTSAHRADAKRRTSVEAKKAGKSRPSISKGMPGKTLSTKLGKSDNKSQKSDGNSQDVGKMSTVRSVDEIISSLKDQSKVGIVSEADKKIQEIMDRVLSRTKEVLGDLAPDEEEAPAGTASPAATPVTGTPIAAATPVTGTPIAAATPVTGTPIAAATPVTDEELSGKKVSSEEPPEAVVSLEQREKTTDKTETVAAPSVTVTDTEAPSSVQKSKSSADDDFTEQQKFMKEAMEQIEEAKRQTLVEEAKMRQEQAETAQQHQQAVEDLNASGDVTYEDIIRVSSKPSLLHAKPSTSDTQCATDGGPTASQTTSGTDIQQPVLLMTSWPPVTRPDGNAAAAAAEAAEPEKHTTQAALTKPPDFKSIHHFCSLREDVQLPDPYRGVWRRYHVPSKFDSYYNKALQLVGDEQLETPSDSLSSAGLTPQGERHSLEQRQSEAARRIMQDARDLGQQSSSLHDWQRRAHAVFDQSDLTVDGQKVELKLDASFLYWTPAPPKWDVPPSVVKQALFPDYHGPSLGEETDVSMYAAAGAEDSADDEDDDDDEEEEDDEEAAEQRLARERTLGRGYDSAQDLTALERAHVEAEGRRRASPQEPSSRELEGQLRLAGKQYTEALSDPKSNDYKLLRGQMDDLLTGVLSQALGRNFHGLTDIAFSAGSLVVKYRIKVARDLPEGTILEDLQAVLDQALHSGKLGDLRVDPHSLSLQVAAGETAEGRQSHSAKVRKTLEEFATHHPHPPVGGLRQMSELTCKMPAATPRGPPAQQDLPRIVHRQRRDSAPGDLDREEEDTLMIYQDFNIVMAEISKQKDQVRELKVQRKRQTEQEETAARLQLMEGHDDLYMDADQAHLHSQLQEEEDVALEDASRSIYLGSAGSEREREPTAAELALAAGRSYVLLPQKSKKTKRKKLTEADMARIEEVERFLEQPANPLLRSQSLPRVNVKLERALRVPWKVRSQIRNSVSNLLDFDAYKTAKGYNAAEEPGEREWVRQHWNAWFDQVYPATPTGSDWEEEDEASLDSASAVKEEKPAKRKSSIASTVYSDNIEVQALAEDAEDQENVELLQGEAERLTELIDSTDRPSAFDFCRRGAIYRKLGKIKQALQDLSSAVALEPQMVDAYWHRHFIFVLQNKRPQALDDLSLLLKHNKSHSGAYRSRAVIFKEQGDVTMAIVNFSQAVKYNPQDYEAYFQRAEMYEKRGELLLAMEDYSTVTKINPAKTQALFKHGMHYFSNGNWQSSVNDFTHLLKQQPNNALARMYRGRAHSQLKNWNGAVEDLSAAVHLDPGNAQAFYYRGCLLRKLHPKRALLDFSVSLMLDDSEDNLMAYLHRAILYNDIGKHEDAIPDLESVLKLDKDMAIAHTSLGLIYMLKMDNYHRAIKKFTAAVKADPNYVKAYICRAEAHTKIHDVKNALLDITRAIHLRPDLHHLYMYRGQLVLKMGDLDLASFCVSHAAALKEGLGHSPTQQAIVQSFLKNYDKAIEALESATRQKPVPSLFLLLGKTQMKARKWKDAIRSFERALELVQAVMEEKERVKRPWQEKQTWPLEAAEMYYLIGMCEMETRGYLNAHDAFNSSIRIDPKCAEAFYWRGMTRMKLRQFKGIQDFNRALALDPTMFQAYLSRAAYYGLKGQYKKGILNCNEAIRLQTSSVRGFLYRGALKYHIKAYTLAIHDLSQAIAIDSQCQLAYFNRAVCHHDSGNTGKALQDYGIVLLLGDYLMLKVLINRGLLYFSINDYKNALHDFLLAANVNPQDKQIHHTLGLCYHKLDRLQEAVQSFTRALELDYFFLDALIGRGNVFMDFGHDVGLMYARRDYERALHLNPECQAARVNLAYSLQVGGKFQQAWHQFSTAIRINPRFQPALEGRAVINLQMSDTFAAFQDISASIGVSASAEQLTNRGVIHQFMGDKVNAMRDYQAALKLDPAYALAYFNAANIYFHSRQFKQALTYYDEALNHHAQDESAILNRAITKVMLKDTTGALSDFEKAIKLSPYSAHMYFNRGNLYASLLDYTKAEEDYTIALQLQPDDPLVHKRRADVRGKLGNKEEAIQDYRHAILIQSQQKQ